MVIKYYLYSISWSWEKII